jgi:hypothetical protein
MVIRPTQDFELEFLKTWNAVRKRCGKPYTNVFNYVNDKWIYNIIVVQIKYERISRYEKSLAHALLLINV